MKLFEFICKYTICPMCGNKLDCLLHVELSHPLLYKLVYKNDCFIFAKGEEIFIVQHNGCIDCSYMPNEFLATDQIEFPSILNKFSINKPYYGNTYISTECSKNDFLYNSTDFNVLKKDQEINIAWERFSASWDRIIYNDYGKQITSIITPEIDKDIGLISLDKWPLNDKDKLKDKIDKLLVLI